MQYQIENRIDDGNVFCEKISAQLSSLRYFSIVCPLSIVWLYVYLGIWTSLAYVKKVCMA